MDDNLPLRKVSLTCVETILDVMPDRVDVLALMQIMPLLLTDKDEIKLQTHQVSDPLLLTTSYLCLTSALLDYLCM